MSSAKMRARSIVRRLGCAGAGLALAVGLGACGAAPTPASLALTPAAAAASSAATPAPSADLSTTTPSPLGSRSSSAAPTTSSRARVAAQAPAARPLRTTTRKLPAAPAAGTYTNSDGQRIERPDANSGGASARCRDGSFSHSTHRQGTCSGHGGVASWL